MPRLAHFSNDGLRPRVRGREVTNGDALDRLVGYTHSYTHSYLHTLEEDGEMEDVRSVSGVGMNKGLELVTGRRWGSFRLSEV